MLHQERTFHEGAGDVEKETLCQTREQDLQTKEEVLKDTGKAGQGSRLVNVAVGAEREELTSRA